jgi:tellurite resistance protein TerB
MGLLGNLKSKFGGTVAKFNGNKDFLEAVCAASALVAYADGVVSKEEEKATIKAISANAIMSASFTSSEIERTAEKMFDRAEGGRVGRNQLYQEIEEASARDTAKEMAHVILLAALDVAGDISDAERSVLTKVAERLRLNLADFE